MALAQKVVSLEDHKEKLMGKPQTEDGYTRLANELMEAIISFPFSSRQMKVVLAIIRKTYGFNKVEDALAQSVLAEMTGIAKSHICTTLKELAAMNVIVIDDSRFAHRISLNKHYKNWTDYQISSYQNSNEVVTETVTKPLPKQSPQKKERKKDNSAALPDWIPSESWDGFVQMRKAIKKPMTDRAMAMVVKKLASFREEGYSPAEILDQSTLKNWQDVFATKTKPVVADDPNALITLPNGTQITRARQKWLLEMSK